MKQDLGSYILTRQEYAIMKIIWEKNTATVREVYEILLQRKEIAYTTVLTFMKILKEKGILSRKLVGRAHHYRPILSRGQAKRNQVNDLLERFFDGNSKELIEAVSGKEFISMGLEEAPPSMSGNTGSRINSLSTPQP